jgi:hypothetical protein
MDLLWIIEKTYYLQCLARIHKKKSGDSAFGTLFDLKQYIIPGPALPAP